MTRKPYDMRPDTGRLTPEATIKVLLSLGRRTRDDDNGVRQAGVGSCMLRRIQVQDEAKINPSGASYDAEASVIMRIYFQDF
jgi:hypothetical protein